MTALSAVLTSSKDCIYLYICFSFSTVKSCCNVMMPNEFIGVDEVCCQASLILIFESYWHLAVRIVLSNVGTHQLL